MRFRPATTSTGACATMTGACGVQPHQNGGSGTQQDGFTSMRMAGTDRRRASFVGDGPVGGTPSRLREAVVGRVGVTNWTTTGPVAEGAVGRGWTGVRREPDEGQIIAVRQFRIRRSSNSIASGQVLREWGARACSSAARLFVSIMTEFLWVTPRTGAVMDAVANLSKSGRRRKRGLNRGPGERRRVTDGVQRSWRVRSPPTRHLRRVRPCQ
jgi:hypothetical protein